MQAWLTHQSIGIQAIGILGLVRLPYSIKFLWAPFLEIGIFRWLPFKSRKSWLLLSLGALFVLISVLATLDPKKDMTLLGCVSLAIAFFGATQAIVTDAIKIEYSRPDDFRLTAAYGAIAFKAGLLCAGAGCLILADHIPWSFIYFVMAGIIATAIPALWLLDETIAKEKQTPHTPSVHFLSSFKEPFLDFFRKPQIGSTIGFLLLYKINILLAVALITSFFLSLGFTNTQVAGSKVGGYFFSFLGTILGSIFLKRFSLYTCLWIFQLSEMISGLLLWALSHTGHHIGFFLFAVLTEDLTSGMGNCGYEVFVMTLCSKTKYCGTQFALITSLMALRRSFITLPASMIIQRIGWEAFFFLAALTALPGLYLLFKHKFGWQVFDSQTTRSST